MALAISVYGQPLASIVTVAPTLSLQASPAMLWPPDHKLVPVSISWTTVDACDPAPAVRLVAVASSEPDNGLGDGDKEGDIRDAGLDTEDHSISLRAERAGGGGGRTYTLTYQVSDAAGNRSERSVTVVVRLVARACSRR